MKKKSTIRIKSEISDDELLFTVTFSNDFNKLKHFSQRATIHLNKTNLNFICVKFKAEYA